MSWKVQVSVRDKQIKQVIYQNSIEKILFTVVLCGTLPKSSNTSGQVASVEFLEMNLTSSSKATLRSRMSASPTNMALRGMAGKVIFGY